MSVIAFLDTNILLRHIMQDVEDQSPRASRLIAEVAEGVVSVWISETVVFETVFTLTSFYRIPRGDVARQVRRIVGMPGIFLQNKAIVLEALRFWESQGPLSFADCYHLALTADLGLDEIYSFDTKMGRYPGVTRIEP
jgi:predicted nucleic-acid-binding protein